MKPLSSKPRLYLIEKKNPQMYFDYIIKRPKRFSSVEYSDMKIRIGFKDGEYQYLPRKFNWGEDAGLTDDELLVVYNEVRRLNKVIK